MPAGRPLKFQSVEELQQKIEEYFESCWTEFPITNKKGKKVGISKVQTKPYTITGLALYLDTSRETLMNYEEREEFFDTIKRAKLKCEQYAEEQLFSKNPTGPIFALKNYGWKDKTEVDQNIKGSISLTDLFNKAEEE